MATLSPMMQHYVDTKENYKDCIIFYRLGDFYEMFFEDALVASKELEITLTGRDCGLKEKAPMCGVPYHAAENYLDRLVQKGYKVAIVEQIEDPKFAKGIVKRDVVRIVTPGTNIASQSLDEKKNHYIMGVFFYNNQFGMAICDITTGEFLVTQAMTKEQLSDAINRFAPLEIVYNDLFLLSGIDLEAIKEKISFVSSQLPTHYYDDISCKQAIMKQFHASSYEALGIDGQFNAIFASGSLLQYLYQTQKNHLAHIATLTLYQGDQYVLLDLSTRRNLELTETMREKQKRGSLLWVLDQTKTAMGARLLRKYIEQPLLDRNEILKRQEIISAFLEQYINREEMREYLSSIYDLERLISKICYGSANPRDLLAFKSSLSMLPHIKNLLSNFKEEPIAEIYHAFDPLESIHDLLEKAIDEEAPLALKESGIIKRGFHEEADRLYMSRTEGRNWILDLEQREREQSGIKTLKIKYNKVFGYYIEVTNSYKDSVPERYIRRQTLASAERFTTPELKELEDTILGAQDKLNALEYELFCQIRESIANDVERIKKTANVIALIDLFISLAVVAERNHYVKPKINKSGIIDIKQGRHPVIEKMMSSDQFVTNDVYLDQQQNRIAIITGPNMAGKSTYMRQTALIAIMAQIGSFVPAQSANVCISDRIFTRVGASDDLSSGQSTFMVEMTEVANILRNATEKSLLILDEIGRGTSTIDGLSIAWAVTEYIANTKLIGAKTLFATHYHELTELEGMISGVNNFCIAVKEQGEDIIFLRKIIKGSADKSYGIQVAKLAGVPEMVINRSKELVQELMDAEIAQNVKAMTTKDTPIKKRIKPLDEVDSNQLTIFETVNETMIIDEIMDLSLSKMTPIDALNTLYQLQIKLKNRIHINDVIDK